MKSKRVDLVLVQHILPPMNMKLPLIICEILIMTERILEKLSVSTKRLLIN